MMRPLESLLVLPVNHLLAQAAWATGRLRQHVGSVLQLQAGPFALIVQITGEGLLRLCDSQTAVDVSVELAADFPLRLLVDRSTLLREARLSGKADVAETLAFVFRNLRWDVEGDLAGVLGDIPARRIVRTGEDAAAGIAEAGRRMVANVVEFATLESGLLITAAEGERFNVEVDRLRDDLARLEKRLARLARPAAG